MLPAELWLDISEHCPVREQVCLALSCTRFFHLLKARIMKTADGRATFVKAAVRFNNTAALTYLRKVGTVPTWRDLLASGNLTLIQDIHRNEKPLTRELLCEEQGLLFRTAALSGNIHLLQWLMTTFHVDLFELDYIFRHAARQGNLPLLQWLYDQAGSRKLMHTMKYAFVYAAKKGHTHVLDWIQTKFPNVSGLRRNTQDYMECVYGRGTWCYSLDNEDYHRIIKNAVKQNRPYIMTYLWNMGAGHQFYLTSLGDQLHMHLMQYMCSRGFLECLQVFWSYNNYVCGDLLYQCCVNRAVMNGHLATLQYLLQHPKGDLRKRELLVLAANHKQAHTQAISEWLLSQNSV